MFNWPCFVKIHCCLLHQQKKSKTAAKPPCKIDLMKLRDKDKQHKLKKKMYQVLAGLQHQQSEVVEENWNSLKATTLDTAFSVLAKSGHIRIGSTILTKRRGVR